VHSASPHSAFADRGQNPATKIYLREHQIVLHYSSQLTSLLHNNQRIIAKWLSFELSHLPLIYLFRNRSFQFALVLCSSQPSPKLPWASNFEKEGKDSCIHTESSKGYTRGIEKMATNSIKLLTGNSHPQLAKQVADRSVLIPRRFGGWKDNGRRQS
jgi:hypothetical protein